MTHRVTRRSPRPVGAAVLVALALVVSLLAAPGPAYADTQGLAITMSGPADGAAVSGTVSFSVTASTDPVGTDLPQSVVLTVDGATVDSASCGVGNECIKTLQWDTTGFVGDRSVVATVTTVEGATKGSTPLLLAANRPTVTISAPSDGATVSGTITVTATATTPPSAPDDPASVQLLVGGVVQDSALCGGGGHSCQRSLKYDATGLTGPLTLTFRVLTTFPQTATDVVTVTVSNAAPTVSIASPTGGTVTGTVDVAVSATTGGNLSDFPATVAVFVDGSAAALGSVTCPAAQHLCTGSVQWNTTAVPGTHTLDAHLVTTKGATADAAQRSVIVSSPEPTISLTSPAAGATVSGTVVVTVDASTDARLSEVPASVTLYADDVAVDTQPCASATHDCPLTLSWDATGATAGHVLKAVVTTTLSRTATSATVAVTVTTPPFDVSITSPASGTVAVGAGATSVSSGKVSIAVSASTDAAQNEFPASVELLVDGISVGSALCGGAPQHACTATLLWDASTSAGPHRLAARLTTSRGHQATSATRILYARSGARVAFASIPTVSFGGVLTVRGRVVSTTSLKPLVGVWVRLLLTPAVGKGRVALVKTGIGGTFSYRTRAYSNTRTTALVGTTWLVKATRATLLRVRAPMVCSTSASAYFSGSLGRGTCVVRNLPAGTGVRLQYYRLGVWTTLASGRTTSTTIPFSFRFVPRGTYYLRVVLATNRVYYATMSRYLKVVIR